ncbi:MAG: hypothetical protein ACK5XN_16435 [Bacteroidota bacterium]|jgi:hypothetical protein
MDYTKGFFSTVVHVTPEMESHYDTIRARIQQVADEFGIDVYVGKFVSSQPLQHANRNIAYEMFRNYDGSVVSVCRYIEPELHYFNNEAWSAQVMKHAQQSDKLMQTLSALVTGAQK